MKLAWRLKYLFLARYFANQQSNQMLNASIATLSPVSILQLDNSLLSLPFVPTKTLYIYYGPYPLLFYPVVISIGCLAVLYVNILKCSILPLSLPASKSLNIICVIEMRSVAEDTLYPSLINADYEYKQYYSSYRLPSVNLRSWGGAATFLLVLFFIILSYRSPLNVDISSRIYELKTKADGEDVHIKRNGHIAMKSMGAEMKCDPEVLSPSSVIPDDVNSIRPADIKAVAALGDSITAGSLSKNFEDDAEKIFPGNSFAIGGDESLATHITIANVLHVFNSSLKGASIGKNMHFNVAQSGMKCTDLPRQAKELIRRMTESKVNIREDWKLVSIFIGTNDIGNLSCYRTEPPIYRDEYKAKLEETLSILKKGLPRSIISIVAMWNPQLTIEAKSIIEHGKQPSCGNDESVIRMREELCKEYRNVAYQIQNEKKFDSKNFTVVIQGFMDNIQSSFRNEAGHYDRSFYADDVFHLSKYGNAVIAKWLWNGLLEPVGRKNKVADLADDSIPLRCPDKDWPYIYTIGNSKGFQY